MRKSVARRTRRYLSDYIRQHGKVKSGDRLDAVAKCLPARPVGTTLIAPSLRDISQQALATFGETDSGRSDPEELDNDNDDENELRDASHLVRILQLLNSVTPATPGSRGPGSQNFVAPSLLPL
jgi:hypothetical protein